MTTAVESFWGQTVLAGPFQTAEQSRASLHARLEMYPGLLEFMPVDYPDQTVLDYGCGPGHDTLLFLTLGRVKLVHYADISQKAIRITRHRLGLHKLAHRGVGIQVGDDDDPILLPRVDHIHCAGVLHHTSNPQGILQAFRRALNPGGEIRLMVYDGDQSPHTQSQVPVTNWWTRTDIAQMATSANLTATYVGSYPCAAPWRPDAHAACYSLT